MKQSTLSILTNREQKEYDPKWLGHEYKSR